MGAEYSVPLGDFRQDSWESQLLFLLVPQAIGEKSRLNSLTLLERLLE